MKNILVLVDFTETADVSVRQAITLAKAKGATIHLCHVFASSATDDGSRTNRFDPYTLLVKEAGIPCSIAIVEGDLVYEVKTLVKAISADLVVIGTHGKHGAKQDLYGAYIYNLVKRMPVPCLVVSDSSKLNTKGFGRILMPISSHDNFLRKVEQACAAASKEATIVIFAIKKPGHSLDLRHQHNIVAAKAEIAAANFLSEIVEVVATVDAIGYSHEILSYIKKYEMDLIVIMAEVYKENMHFGTIDKENLILNKLGVPVLCC